MDAAECIHAFSVHSNAGRDSDVLRVKVRVRDIRGCCVYGGIAEEEVQEQCLCYGWEGGCAACC